MNVADLRREYARQILLENEAAADPIDQFNEWWKQAIEA
jgi:pyridoxine/pyridoxamine 5'-phosphate oxidase